jgi:hypothetical protein
MKKILVDCFLVSNNLIDGAAHFSGAGAVTPCGSGSNGSGVEKRYTLKNGKIQYLQYININKNLKHTESSKITVT